MASLHAKRRALILTALLLQWSLSVTTGHNRPSHDHKEQEGIICGFDPTPESYLVDEARSIGLEKAQRRRRRKLLQSCHELCEQCIEIETRVHFVTARHESWTVIPHPTSSYERLLDNDETILLDDFSTSADIEVLFQENLEVLNRAFWGTPFRFWFNATASRSLVNTEWTDFASEFRTDIYNALASGDPEILDVFLVQQMYDRQTNTSSTAMSSFAGEQLDKEGVVMRYDALAGGGHSTHDTGHILVHEVGHFLGLFHTFQTFNIDPCNDPLGDLVDDTSPQNGDSKGSFPNCTAYLHGQYPLPDTCKNGVADPFFNFMNYVSQGVCWDQGGSFTCGQIERMHRHYRLFREHVSSCEDTHNEMEIEVVLLIDEDYDTENLIRLKDSSTGEELFNSYSDFASILSNRRGPGPDARPPSTTIFFDLCVPRDHTYLITIIDRKQNGFSNGLAQVFRDRELYASINGDFGETVVVEIQESTGFPLPLIITSDDLSRATAEPAPAQTTHQSPPRVPLDTTRGEETSVTTTPTSVAFRLSVCGWMIIATQAILLHIPQ